MSELNKESVEQAGGDERAKFEYWASDEGIYPKAVERSGNCYKLAQTQSYWMAWQARAALASTPVADESPMAKMADALREKARQEQQAYQDRRNQATEWGPMPEGTEADRPISIAPVAHVAGDETSRYLEWAKDRSAWEMPVGTPVYYAALAQPSPAPDLAERGTTTEQTCRHDFYGVWWNRNGVTKTGRECRHCGFFVEDATEALAEQAEAERPEVVAWRYDSRGGIVSDKACLDEWKSGGEYQSLMTVAQHECIVGELRAVIAQLRQHKNDYMDSGQETYRALQNEIREREAEIARLDGLVSGRTAERDAALARVADMKTMADNYCALLMDANAKLAEMEKQEPVATVARVPGEDWNGLHFYRDLKGIPSGTKLYTAPVAQAQHSVPEVSGIGRDFAYPRSVVLYLRTEPTDDDLRAIHDGLRSLAAAPGNGRHLPQIRPVSGGLIHE
ncbi:hypothetical protein [Pseudomonas phage TC6]|uniref:Uncharacterized protein n=1 Tax=Pseudomonas phage TC6 TaxID=2060947 RepID=A0A2H5BQE8_9CAUD|nr:hypothetical protein [Pseudomonas phage TC6]